MHSSLCHSFIPVHATGESQHHKISLSTTSGFDKPSITFTILFQLIQYAHATEFCCDFGFMLSTQADAQSLIRVVRRSLLNHLRSSLLWRAIAGERHTIAKELELLQCS